jgi:hypothetical protein
MCRMWISASYNPSQTKILVGWILFLFQNKVRMKWCPLISPQKLAVICKQFFQAISLFFLHHMTPKVLCRVAEKSTWIMKWFMVANTACVQICKKQWCFCASCLPSSNSRKEILLIPITCCRLPMTLCASKNESLSFLSPQCLAAAVVLKANIECLASQCLYHPGGRSEKKRCRVRTPCKALFAQCRCLCITGRNDEDGHLELGVPSVSNEAEWSGI